MTSTDYAAEIDALKAKMDAASDEAERDAFLDRIMDLEEAAGNLDGQEADHE
jgi:hypothetical protein